MWRMNGLFHAEVWMPESLIAQACKAVRLFFTRHAQHACRTDRYGYIIPPTQIAPQRAQVVEVEAANGKVNKVVARLPYNQQFDIVVVYMPEQETGIVKTLWLNEKSDRHSTLNRSKYVRGPLAQR